MNSERGKRGTPERSIIPIIIIAIAIVSVSATAYAVFSVQQMNAKLKLEANWIIDGDTVSIESQYGRIDVTPHTAHPDPFGCYEQEVSLLWKGPAMELDFAIALDDIENAKWTDKQAFLWRRYVHDDLQPVYGNVNQSRECEGALSLDPAQGVAYCDTGYEGYPDGWEHGYDWVEGNTVIWNATGVVGYEAGLEFEDWYPITSLFTHTEYSGKHYYWVSGVHFGQGEEKRMMVKYCTGPGSNGKWELFAKRSSESLADALANNNYIHLDPWWDSFSDYLQMAAHSPKTDTIFYMPFENGYADESSSANHGSPTTNSKINISGAVGQTAEFDHDTTNYIDMATPITPFDDSFSVTLWIKSFESDPGAERVFISSYDGDTNIKFGTSSTNNRIVYWATNALGGYTDNVDYDNGEWQHLAYTYNNASNTLQFYMNGSLMTTNTYNPGDISTNGFRIGEKHAATGAAFDGLIDEIKIYEKVLTTQEISRQYETERFNNTPAYAYGPSPSVIINSSLNTTEVSLNVEWRMNGTLNRTTGPYDSSLVSWWPMDFDGQDYGPGRNDCSPSGTPVLNQTYAKLGGGSYEFDGTNDYLSCGSDASLDLANGTISFWIFPDGDIPANNVPLSKDANGNNGGDASFIFEYCGGGDDVIGMLMQDGTNNHCLVGDTVPKNEWTHIVGTFNNAEGAKIYQNGELINSTASTRGWTRWENTFRIATFIGSTNFFSGLMDDVRVYNVTFDAANVSRLYYAGRYGGLTVPETHTNNNENWTVYITPYNSSEAGATASDFIYYFESTEVAGTPADIVFNDTDWHISAGAPDNGTGLVFYMPFEQGYVDRVSGNDGVGLSTARLNITCMTGQCLEGSYAEMGNTISVTDFTVMLWAKSYEDNPSSEMCFLSSYDGDTHIRFCTSNTNDRLTYWAWNGKGGYRDNLDYDNGEWQHLAYTYDNATDTLTLYMNGTEISTNTYNPGDGSTQNFRIGLSSTGGSAFNGLIDEVRIYDRVLTQAEIQQQIDSALNNASVNFGYSPSLSLNESSVNSSILSFDVEWHRDGVYNRSTGNVTDEGLVSWWPMDFNGADYAAGRNTCTPGNTPNLNQTYAKLGGGSYAFDGVNEYLSCGSDASLDLAVGTISFWIYPNSVAYSETVMSKDANGNNAGDAGFVFETIYGGCGGGDDVLGMIMQDGADNYCVEGTKLSMNEWTFITGTWNGSHIVFYQDGEQMNMSAYSGGWTRAANTFRMGTFIATGNYFDGLLDDVRVYNRSLSGQEIIDMYYAGKYGGLTVPRSHTRNNENWTVYLRHNNNSIIGDFSSYSILVGGAPPADTCTYGGSGDWGIAAADNCNITTSYDLGGNNISITGTGTITVYGANITNFTRLYIAGTDSSNKAYVECLAGGCFRTQA